MKQLNPEQKLGLATGGTAAIMALGLYFIPQYEGTSLTPYFDSVGVETVCRGETRVEMREYTMEECDKLTSDMIDSFAERVAQLAPGIEKYPWQWWTHTSVAINNGKQAYATSSMRRLFNQGKYVEACRYMRKYRYAGGRIMQGLVNRRNGTPYLIGEYEACLVDAIPAQLGVI